jgi:hypothetical protein
LAKSSSYDNGHKFLYLKDCCIPSHYHQAAWKFLPSPLAFRRINGASHTRWPLAPLPVGNAEKKKKRKKGKKKKKKTQTPKK